MSAPTVRPAGPEDHATLVAFQQAMARESEGRELDGPTLAAGVTAGLADPAKARYLLAEREGRAVGCLMLTLEWSDWRNGWFWWIQSVYTAPEARRTGVYRALYAHVLERARADPEVCGLRLYVEDENRPARETYRALGMERAGYDLWEVDFSGPSEDSPSPSE